MRAERMLQTVSSTRLLLHPSPTRSLSLVHMSDGAFLQQLHTVHQTFSIWIRNLCVIWLNDILSACWF